MNANIVCAIRAHLIMAGLSEASRNYAGNVSALPATVANWTE